MAVMAPVQRQARADINAAWPARLTKASYTDSDGWIADKNHKPPSDHLPDGKGMTHALDIDVDALDVNRLMAALFAHPSTRYVIYKDKIYHRSAGFKAARYTGKYHTHLHWSIEHTTAAENSAVRLALTGGVPKPASGTASTQGTGGIVKFATLRYNPGTDLAAVRTLQRAANAVGAGLTVDGRFGGGTLAWVKAFQTRAKLTPDGVVGAKTWCALVQALLNRFGYGLAVDGKFGPKTAAAILAFQRSRGLSADGWFGPKTLTAASS